MTIWGLLLIATIVMKLWPETHAAQWLHKHLVERPLDMVGRIRRRHIIFLIIGFAVMYSFAEIGAPHLGFVAAIDISAYVDVVITTLTVAALARTRGGWTALRGRIGLPLRRSVSRPDRKTPSNDDDGHGAFALAA